MLLRNEILTLQYSSDGAPWTLISAKSSINLDTLEYSADGSPWYGVEDIPASSFTPIIMWFY